MFPFMFFQNLKKDDWPKATDPPLNHVKKIIEGSCHCVVFQEVVIEVMKIL